MQQFDLPETSLREDALRGGELDVELVGSGRHTLVLMLVIFLIAQPSPDLRCLAATTQPYAPWPSSLTNWYSESTTKVELSAVNECLCIAVVDGMC